MRTSLKLLGVFAVLIIVGAGCAGGDSGSASKGELATGTGVITVTSHAAGDSISSGFRIEGETTTADGKVYLRLIDKDGATVVSSNVKKSKSLSGTDNGYVFTYVIFFSKNFGEGILEVYGINESGDETDLIQIPVVLAPKE